MSTGEIVARGVVCTFGLWLVMCSLDQWREFRDRFPIVVGVIGVVVMIGAWVP